MAISEVSLRDVVLMAVEEINAKGGVMGRPISPVVVDPASNWDLFAEKAKQLLLQDKVAVTFGCWTSVSRKSVLPVFENNNGLLFYPVQYEGEECSKNVFYTGATPNQQLIPGAEYLMSKEGGAYKKFYLLGTDYVFPRTANKILRAFLLAKGVPAANIEEEYTPFSHQDYQTIVGKIKRFSSGGGACVLSTINGDSNVPFYKEFANQGLRSENAPIMAYSVAEDELRGMDTSALVGHLAAWNYFQSIENANNKKFVNAFKEYAQKKGLPGGAKRVTDDPMEAGYFGVYIWKQAVEKAKTFDVDPVRKAVYGQTFAAPSGTAGVQQAVAGCARGADRDGGVGRRPAGGGGERARHQEGCERARVHGARVGLDKPLGARDDLELAVLEDLADEHGAEGVVVVLVHLDGAARRRERLAVDGLADRIDVERLGLLDGLLPDVDAEVARLHRVVRHALGAAGQALLLRVLLERVHELLVVRVLDGLEVVPRREVADQRGGIHAAQLVLGHAVRNDRRVLASQTLIGELLVEGHVAVAVDRRQHARAAARGEALDLADDRLVVLMAERRVLLLDVRGRHALGEQERAEDLVGGARA